MTRRHGAGRLPVHLHPRPLRIDSTRRLHLLRTSQFAGHLHQSARGLLLPLAVIAALYLLAVLTRDHMWIGFTFADVPPLNGAPQ